MERKVFDDDMKIIESSNSGLLIQNEKSLKIHLEGFPISEFVELMKIVKDHGGEISSRVEAGVIVLSRPNYSVKIDSPHFDVKWLHDCISSSKILNPSKYQLAFPTTNIKPEIEEKYSHPIEPVNVKLQHKNHTAYSLKEAVIKIPKISHSPKINASPGIISENLVPEDESEIRRTPKNRKCSQPSVYRSSDSPEANKSSKINRYSIKRYTEEEDKAMIQYLIDNDAIDIAGGTRIWNRMHKDGMMQHRSVLAMQKYFSQSLRYKIQDVTSDEEALRKFQLRESELLKFEARKRRRSD